MRDGAIGETYSTLLAAVTAHQAFEKNQKSIAILHRSIAIDESRHAALAWRTLAWAIAKDSSLINDLQPLIYEQQSFSSASNNEENKLHRKFVEKLLIPLSKKLFHSNNLNTIELLNNSLKNDQFITNHLQSLIKDFQIDFVDSMIESIVENVGFL